LNAFSRARIYWLSSTSGAQGEGTTGEQIRARHILIRYVNAKGNQNRPPKSPREQARAALEEEKRDGVIEEIVARRHVQVAEDFPSSLK
jgi:hypothetical protein